MLVPTHRTHPDPLQENARRDGEPKNTDVGLELGEQRQQPRQHVQLVAKTVISRQGKRGVKDGKREDQQAGDEVDREQVFLDLDAGHGGARDEVRAGQHLPSLGEMVHDCESGYNQHDDEDGDLPVRESSTLAAEGFDERKPGDGQGAAGQRH